MSPRRPVSPSRGAVFDQASTHHPSGSSRPRPTRPSSRAPQSSPEPRRLPPSHPPERRLHSCRDRGPRGGGAASLAPSRPLPPARARPPRPPTRPRPRRPSSPAPDECASWSRWIPRTRPGFATALRTWRYRRCRPPSAARPSPASAIRGAPKHRRMSRCSRQPGAPRLRDPCRGLLAGGGASWAPSPAPQFPQILIRPAMAPGRPARPSVPFLPRSRSFLSDRATPVEAWARQRGEVAGKIGLRTPVGRASARVRANDIQPAC